MRRGSVHESISASGSSQRVNQSPAPPVEVVHGLVEEQPEPPEWIGPQITDDHASLNWQMFGSTIDHEDGLTPAPPVIVTPGHEHVRLRSIRSSNPGGEKAPLRGTLDPDGHAVVEVLHRVFGKWVGVQARWE